MHWSPKQELVLELGGRGHWLTIVSGPVRSGKSESALAGFLIWAGKNFRGHNFLIASKTMTQVRANLLPIAEKVARAAGVASRRRLGEKYIQIGANKFYLYDGQDEGSLEKLQGLTFAGAFVDELTVMPRSFFEEVIVRCSVAGRKIVATCNPEGPQHWLKTDYIDRAGDLDIEVIEFAMTDNPSLSANYVQTLIASLTGVFLRRRVYGEWAAASGMVYPQYQIEPPPDTPPYRYDWAVDHATSSVTHGIVFASWAEPKVNFAIAEYRYDGRIDGQRSDAEQAADMFQRWAEFPPRVVWIDPHALSMRAEMRRHLGKRTVRDANNDVLPGIQATQSALASGRLRFSPAVPETIRELAAYGWDEAAAQTGVDRPRKADDHGMDATRYYVYSRLQQQRTRRVTVVES